MLSGNEMKDKVTRAGATVNDTEIVTTTPKGDIVLIKDRCKSCGFCIEFCPKKALEFSSENNAKGYCIPRVKDPAKCILCGFCSMYCPDFAIYQIKNDKDGKKE